MTNKVAEVITNKFLEAIKTTGKLPWTKPWTELNMRNALSGKDYNGINVLMLSMFGKGADFITFNQAKDNGGFVKAGSKGLPICFFKGIDKKDNAGKPVIVNGKASKWLLLRYSTVFNLSDIDGCDALKKKASERAKRIEFAPNEACERLANGIDIVIRESTIAAYSPEIHALQMPPKELFKSVEHYYVVLFHEIGHAMSKEVGHDISSEFGSDPYAKEELVAELFANFCMSYAGIVRDDLFDNSAAYLQGWTKKLTSDPTILISAASKAFKRFQKLLANAGLVEVKEEIEETAVAA